MFKGTLGHFPTCSTCTMEFLCLFVLIVMIKFPVNDKEQNTHFYSKLLYDGGLRQLLVQPTNIYFRNFSEKTG